MNYLEITFNDHRGRAALTYDSEEREGDFPKPLAPPALNADSTLAETGSKLRSRLNRWIGALESQPQSYADRLDYVGSQTCCQAIRAFLALPEGQAKEQELLDSALPLLMKPMPGQGRWLEAGAIHDASNQGRSLLRSLSQHALERQ